jgi:hypothetical protein
MKIFNNPSKILNIIELFLVLIIFKKADLFNQCHIYSYPYEWKCYKNITNNFPGGLFKCVYEVSLFDERPFEHEFFLQIAQSFPFMKK